MLLNGSLPATLGPASVSRLKSELNRELKVIEHNRLQFEEMPLFNPEMFVEMAREYKFSRLKKLSDIKVPSDAESMRVLTG